MNGLIVAKQVALVDSGICHPEKCSGGVCHSVGSCPKKSTYTRGTIRDALYQSVRVYWLWSLCPGLPGEGRSNDINRCMVHALERFHTIHDRDF
jgi:hypothetical protein